MQKANTPLALQGTKNTRELGGYLTNDGRITKKHVYLRSDELHELTDSDRTFLLDYGLRLDMDLRTAAECLAARDEINRKVVEYVDISLLKEEWFNVAVDAVAAPEFLPRTISDVYVQIVDNSQGLIAEVLSGLIAQQDCALFHCTNGKDRTGIIAMFLLEIAGVPEDTIVADYSVSENYVRPSLALEHEALEAQYGKYLPKGAFESKPEYMQTLLDHLKKTYGSPIEYLQGIGITRAQMDHLKDKFVEDAPQKA